MYGRRQALRGYTVQRSRRDPPTLSTGLKSPRPPRPRTVRSSPPAAVSSQARELAHYLPQQMRGVSERERPRGRALCPSPSSLGRRIRTGRIQNHPSPTRRTPGRTTPLSLRGSAGAVRGRRNSPFLPDCGGRGGGALACGRSQTPRSLRLGRTRTKTLLTSSSCRRPWGRCRASEST